MVIERGQRCRTVCVRRTDQGNTVGNALVGCYTARRTHTLACDERSEVLGSSAKCTGFLR